LSWKQYLHGVRNLRLEQTEGYQPLFSAPQQSHFKIVFLFPVELSRRFPQSVQKTRDPIADMLGDFGADVKTSEHKNVIGER